MAEHRTVVARMLISLGLADDIVDTIMDKQGYNTPHALSCLDKKGVEMLASAICKPDEIKSGTQNPVPIQSQEIIRGACFALKYQHHYGIGKYCPSHITLDSIEELWFQQEIEEAYNNKVDYDIRPTWDVKNCNAGTDLIRQHFCQIQGINGAPCPYLMHKNA